MSAAATIPTDHLAGKLLAADGGTFTFQHYTESVQNRYRILARTALEVMAKAEADLADSPRHQAIAIEPLTFNDNDKSCLVAPSAFGPYKLMRAADGWDVIFDDDTVNVEAIVDLVAAEKFANDDLFARVMRSLRFEAQQPETEERSCKICGCTDSRACVDEDGPCHWPSPGVDVCSSCANKMNTVSVDPDRFTDLRYLAQQFAGALATGDPEKVEQAGIQLHNAVQWLDLAQETDQSAALADVIAERQRQIEEEGWTTEHDDQHDKCELAKAAVAYAYFATRGADVREHYNDGALDVRNMVVWKRVWPWSQDWWKPKTQRFDLIRAAALILAEIERLDRKYDAEEWAPEPDADLPDDEHTEDPAFEALVGGEVKLHFPAGVHIVKAVLPAAPNLDAKQPRGEDEDKCCSEDDACGDEDQDTPRGQFGHHPDPAIDAEIEVGRLTGCLQIARAGLYRALDYKAVTPHALSIKATVRSSLDYSDQERVL